MGGGGVHCAFTLAPLAMAGGAAAHPAKVILCPCIHLVYVMSMELAPAVDQCASGGEYSMVFMSCGELSAAGSRVVLCTWWWWPPVGDGNTLFLTSQDEGVKRLHMFDSISVFMLTYSFEEQRWCVCDYIIVVS